VIIRFVAEEVYTSGTDVWLSGPGFVTIDG